jgi:hypothetical protein
MAKADYTEYQIWLQDFFPEGELFFKRMFGGLAVYYRGKMILLIIKSPGESSYKGKKFKFDIWNGILLPTSHEFHSRIYQRFPEVVQHPVLGKWLYLPFNLEEFETIAENIAKEISREIPDWGIVPKVKRKLKKKTKINPRKKLSMREK